jgi:hypothetical protein
MLNLPARLFLSENDLPVSFGTALSAPRLRLTYFEFRKPCIFFTIGRNC